MGLRRILALCTVLAAALGYGASVAAPAMAATSTTATGWVRCANLSPGKFKFFPVLNPSQKTEHIRKYWGDDKSESILEQAEETVSVYISGYVMNAYRTISAVQEALN